MGITHGGIEVELQGGLGNQLFGWACAFSMSKRLSLQLLLNTTHLTQHGFQLKEIDHAAKVINTPNQNLGRLTRFTNNRIFQESSFMYDRRISSIQSSILLRGYFQSWKYFHEDSSEIKNAIFNKGLFTSKAKEVQSLMENSNLNVVHIRRGDYNQLQNYHGLTSQNYYNRAKMLIHKYDQNCKYIVFSDDIDAAKETWPGAEYYISQNDIPSPIENLILMSQGRNFIGSNSSFSWWASFINPNEGIRIFPRPWFSTTEHDTRDLLLPDWLTIGNDPVD